MKYDDLSRDEQRLLSDPPQIIGPWTNGALNNLLTKGLLRIQDTRTREISYTETTYIFARSEAGYDLLAVER